jgi:hypothetical protein
MKDNISPQLNADSEHADLRKSAVFHRRSSAVNFLKFII